MKSFTFIIILFSTFITGYAQKAGSVKSDTSQMAKIVFDKTLYDFGTIPREGSATCTFTFENKGKSPLVISNVKARCDCTVPSWSKTPVKPGQTGKITLKYTPDHRGDFLQDITVQSNAVNSSVEIQIKGVIK